jgi:tRNA threonylcarbamoyladenosine biosynthesis protein TsaB
MVRLSRVTILGFDTSTAASTAAVLRADGEAFEVAPAPARLAERPAHAAELLPAVAEAMRLAGVGFADLDAIAVGVGPGGFTGLRIGVATARALAKARGLPLRPVGSLAALAAGMPEGGRLALIDAKRGEVYAALYDGDAEVWPPFAATPDALLARLRADCPGFSVHTTQNPGQPPGAAAPLAAGDGSLRFRDQLEAAGVAVAPPESPLHVVRAASLCRLAVGAPDAAPEQVRPDYLREPDAAAR